MTYEIVVRPEADGTYRAICPQIVGVQGRGESAGQALDAAVVALNTALARQRLPQPQLSELRARLSGPARV